MTAENKPSIARKRMLAILTAVVPVSALVILGLSLSRLAVDQPIFDFLDVGQGDAILIRQGWEDCLIDGGPDRSIMAGLGQSLPFLDRRLETVVATHPHDDHIKGLLPVLERYQVDRLLVPAALADDRDYQPLYRVAESRGVEVLQAEAGDRFAVGSVEMSVIWPPADCLALLVKHDFDIHLHNLANICSLVIRAEHCDPAGCRSVLLTGDATSESEAIMLEQGVLEPTDILKVGHHGSRFSTSLDFVRAVRPVVAVIQSGYNRFGHPNLGVLLRLESAGAHIWRNDLHGAIRAVPEGAGFLVQPR